MPGPAGSFARWRACDTFSRPSRPPGRLGGEGGVVLLATRAALDLLLHGTLWLPVWPEWRDWAVGPACNSCCPGARARRVAGATWFASSGGERDGSKALGRSPRWLRVVPLPRRLDLPLLARFHYVPLLSSSSVLVRCASLLASMTVWTVNPVCSACIHSASPVRHSRNVKDHRWAPHGKLGQ